jgi:hypothetical protein
MEEIEDTELDRELEQLADEADFELSRDKPEPLEPVEARLKVRAWLVEHAGQTVSNADLLEVRKTTGYGRAWGYKIMGEFEADGLVTRLDTADGIVWRVTTKRDILSRVTA